jgi:DNA-directed RNA polymerase subunit RPC12/RpoP
MTAAASEAYKCGGCGARVEYAPGTRVLRCPYCGYEQQLARADRTVREHAIEELRTLARKPVGSIGAHVFVCARCGAKTEADALAERCQFCGAPVVADAAAGQQICPEAVLPFELDRNGMREALRAWASSRWFAPGRLKKVTEAESTKGTYLPHWTYDADTVSDYTGSRGEYYYVTETYTETVNGQQQTRTRQVRRTRWYPTSGRVSRRFDDMIVVATDRVPQEHLEKLEPWPLFQAVPYEPGYLAGYQALRYDVEPETGLATAKQRMEPAIRDDCRHDIGGDEQRVNSVDTDYHDVTFKLMLLPVWIACYLYAGKTYQVLVNGRTGEVCGQRPYSWAKITAAVLAALVLLTVIIVLFARSR